MRFLAIALCLVLLAGCLGSSTSTTSGSPGATGPAGSSAPSPTTTGNSSPATASAAKPQPIKIHDSGDLATGVEKAWPWTLVVGPYKSYTVTLRLDGPNGAPQYMTSGLHATLQSPTGKETIGSGSSAPVSTSFTVTSNGCLICKDYSKQQVAAGDWKLSFGVSSGAGTYTVDVVVDY